MLFARDSKVKCNVSIILIRYILDIKQYKERKKVIKSNNNEENQFALVFVLISWILKKCIESSFAQFGKYPYLTIHEYV